MNSFYGRREAEFNARRKSLLTSYALLLFLGPLGAHRFYLGRKVTGGLMLVTSIGLAFVGFKLLQSGFVPELFSFRGLSIVPAYSAVALGVWSWIDALFLPAIVGEHNAMLEEEIWGVMGQDDPANPNSAAAAAWAVELHPSDRRFY